MTTFYSYLITLQNARMKYVSIFVLLGIIASISGCGNTPDINSIL